MNLITLFFISMSYLITANKGELFDLVYSGPKHRKSQVLLPRMVSVLTIYRPASTEETEQLGAWINS